MIISTYVDTILEKVAKKLGVEISEYLPENDPTKQAICEQEWTIPSDQVKKMDKEYGAKVKELNKKRKSLGIKEEIDSKCNLKRKLLKKEEPTE